MSPSIAVTSFRNLDDETRNKLQSLPNNDQVLAQAIRGSRVVVGQVGSATPAPRSQSEAALQTGFAVRGPDPSRFVVTFAGLLRNVAPIEQAAATTSSSLIMTTILARSHTMIRKPTSSLRSSLSTRPILILIISSSLMTTARPSRTRNRQRQG